MSEIRKTKATIKNSTKKSSMTIQQALIIRACGWCGDDEKEYYDLAIEKIKKQARILYLKHQKAKIEEELKKNEEDE